MKARWNQAFSLAMLSLVVACIATLDTRLTDPLDEIFNGTVDDALKIMESVFETGISRPLSESLGVLAQFTMGHETTPPVSSRLVTSGFESNVTIGLYCTGCDVLAKPVRPSAFNFTKTKYNYSGWDESWLGFALNSFDAFFELDIDLSANADSSLTLSLLKISEGLDGVIVDVEFQLYLVATAQAEMSFTAGMNLSLLTPAAVMIPALDPLMNLTGSKGFGFDKSNFKLTPIFNASRPELDFSVQISLRTVIGVTVEEVNIGALMLDLPAFKFTAATVTDSLSNCKPPPAGTASDQIYAELIHITGDLVAELSYELLGGDESGSLDNWTMWDGFHECYAFFPGLGYIGAPPPSSKSKLLTAPPITTCTTGAGPGATGIAGLGQALRGLSTGEKVGAVIGIVAGVTAIALLAFFAGRGNVKHAMKKARKSPSWTPIPKQSTGSSTFFGLNKHRSARGFSSVAPNEQTWQASTYTPTTEYGGGYFPASNTKMGEHAGWQMFAKEPFVSMAETNTMTPGSTYDDGYNNGVVSPISGTGETTYSTLPSMNRSSYRGEPGEGLGLLQIPETPIMQSRQISRKSVAGQRL